MSRVVLETISNPVTGGVQYIAKPEAGSDHALVIVDKSLAEKLDRLFEEVERMKGTNQT